jgi:hypothetical protein
MSKVFVGQLQSFGLPEKSGFRKKHFVTSKIKSLNIPASVTQSGRVVSL